MSAYKSSCTIFNFVLIFVVNKHICLLSSFIVWSIYFYLLRVIPHIFLFSLSVNYIIFINCYNSLHCPKYQYQTVIYFCTESYILYVGNIWCIKNWQSFFYGLLYLRNRCETRRIIYTLLNAKWSGSLRTFANLWQKGCNHLNRKSDSFLIRWFMSNSYTTSIFKAPIIFSLKTYLIWLKRKKW